MPATQLPTDNRRLTTVSNQRYLPFGEVRTDVGTPITQTDFGYTGQRNNTYIKLLDYGARWYSSSLGRFTQPDSIVPDLTNTQAWNRFSYVINNPVNYTDPTGHYYLCEGGECFTIPNDSVWATGGSDEDNSIVAGVCGTDPSDLTKEYPCITSNDEDEEPHFRDLDKKGAEYGFDVEPVPYRGSKIGQARDINGSNTNKVICYSGGVDSCLLWAVAHARVESLSLVLIGGGYSAQAPNGSGMIGLNYGPPGYENGFAGIINGLADQGANILVIYDGNYVNTQDSILPRANVQVVESPENHYTVDDPDSSMWPHIFSWLQDSSYNVPNFNYWE